jgi:hypothetical protein
MSPYTTNLSRSAELGWLSQTGGKPTFASIGASDKAALKAAVEAFLRIALPLRLASSQPPTRN